MSIELNGKTFDVDCPVTIKDLLRSKMIDVDRVAVEVNYQIVLKKDWDSFMINNDDKIEVIQFVGGG